jgi:hypothetical protein
MGEKHLENGYGFQSTVNNLLYCLISISIIGAAFIVIMLAACITALRATTEEIYCGKKRTYSLAYGKSILLRNPLT